jgi:hypothetical protein
LIIPSLRAAPYGVGWEGDFRKPNFDLLKFPSSSVSSYFGLSKEGDVLLPLIENSSACNEAGKHKTCAGNDTYSLVYEATSLFICNCKETSPQEESFRT